jgi:tetratricopeptide (TPR) repeat protein
MLTGSILYYAVHDVKSNVIEGEADQIFQERDLWLAGIKYKEAIEIDAYDASAYQKLASVLFLQRRYDDALDVLEKAGNLSGDASILLLQGEINTALNQDRQAIANYRLLIKRFPNLVTAHFILAQLYIKQKNWTQARLEFETVLSIVPSETNVQMTKEKVNSQKKMAAYYLKILLKLEPTKITNS